MKRLAVERDEFFWQLHSAIKKADPAARVAPPGADVLRVTIGRKGITFRFTAPWGVRKVLALGFYVDTNQVADSKALLDSHKERIVEALGEDVLWASEPSANKVELNIRRERSVDPSNREAWPEYLEWCVSQLARFQSAFAPVIEVEHLPIAPPLTGPVAWRLLAFGDDRQYAGNTGYEGDPTRVYQYDSFVANHRRVAEGDYAVLCNRVGVVGVAQILHIEERLGSKPMQRCPECDSTRIKERKTIAPPYRCQQCGAVFRKPNKRERECTHYTAHFLGTFVASRVEISADQVRQACVRWNDQHAMQPIDPRLVSKALGEVVAIGGAVGSVPTKATDGLAERVFEPKVLAQIRARRGQQRFREKLLDVCDARCAVTDCRIVEVLEACHLVPHARGADYSTENGLLLRADVHTLFDLDLFGIEPVSMSVHLHPALVDSEYAPLQGVRLKLPYRLAKAALRERWMRFREKRSQAIG